jgi:hypothetical protein
LEGEAKLGEDYFSITNKKILLRPADTSSRGGHISFSSMEVFYI